VPFVTVPHFAYEAWQYVFNTPLECGLRCATLLVAVYPERCDLQRLVQYEYLLVHSGDVRDGPPSVHPVAPHRAGELLVRRGLVERGVSLMLSRWVICRECGADGLAYYAGEWGVPFLDMLRSPYTLLLKQRAAWVADRFGSWTNSRLDKFMRENWTNWGSEFTREFLVREGLV